jgi:N-dimethylarginine dimethylaminohydrolase
VVFDAANICRLGNDLLYLVSESGNRQGAEWLREVLPNHKIHLLDNIYSGVHIDSTISPVREGLVVLNADRITNDNIPNVLKSWDKIWISGDEIVPQKFIGYPYASKYIALNFLTVNSNLIICDPAQVKLRQKLSRHNVDSIGVELRHSRTLGGGHHCVTLDLMRD